MSHPHRSFVVMSPPLTPPGKRLTLERYDASVPPGTPMQPGFHDLGLGLHEATFVVVDLETTGGSPTKDRITEIGAVKVRGGEVLGEFATLINPGIAIPPQITALTGITSAMVVGAPPLAEVLPSFLEFSRGAFIVAHNARFDMGFLRAAARSLNLSWRYAGQVDTLALARRVVTKDEAPNHKLLSLARLFGSSITPDHRALTDARATVDVLHGLLERLGSLGVTHVEDLATAADPVPARRRRRVSMTQNAPQGPGVYVFRGPNREALYVGTAKNLRRRLRQYFTSSPDRRRIGEMVDLANSIETIPCPTSLEAQVRELRLIAEYDPPYNRRSKRPHQRSWVRLTSEPLPRPSIVRSVLNDQIALGPFSGRRQAQEAVRVLEELGLRSCTLVLPAQVLTSASACTLYDLGKCEAPCVSQASADSYGSHVHAVQIAVTTDARTVVSRLTERMRCLARAERFEDAARIRDQLTAFLRGVHMTQRLDPWWRSRNTIAARWSTDTHPMGAWEIVVARHGRLVASGVCPPGRDPLRFAIQLSRQAAYVEAPTRRAGAASAEETTLIANWMETPGVRLIEHTGEPIALPLHGAKRYLDRLLKTHPGEA